MVEERTLEQFVTQDPPASEDGDTEYSRRQFLSGAMVGGAAGLAVAAGSGVVVWNLADAEAQAALEAADGEIARLQGLLELYEDLEKIGLDAILGTGLKAVALPLEAVELGARALKSGLDLVENALLSLEEALPTAEESILWLEAQVSAVAGALGKLELALGKVVERATDNPVAEALGDFVSLVLENLPFGLGDKIRDSMEGLVALVTSVDDLIAGINTQILEPLRGEWLSSEQGTGLASAFVESLVEHVMDPLQAHLEELAVLADTWQEKLVGPTQQALEERTKVQEEIERYKQKHGFV